jgi:cytidyltransferase-like protein
MNIGLFGGSFDPIHRGHLALAQTAASRYSLRQVLFVPANVPPHKQKQPLTAFIHRYAMVALGTQDERGFVPSLLEAAAGTTATLRNGARRARYWRNAISSWPAVPDIRCGTWPRRCRKIYGLRLR